MTGGAASSHSATLRAYPHATTHPCRLRLITPEPTETVAPRVWFAILTYNALAYTKRCLASLDLYTTVPWHAIILDNMSTDGTREWLASLDDSRVTVALSETNRGVAGGRNDLLDLVLPRISDDGFVVFVDNDLEFHPNWIKPFMQLFDRQPTAGMASVSGHEIVVHGERRELLSLPGHVTMPVDVASGGFACFVRPAVFNAIGRYDEELNPFWHEDDDISVRALAAGWDVYAVPTAGVVHHGHKSGVALPSLTQGGSLDKQRYLVDKWRRMGLVQSDGRLDYGRTPSGRALGERLQLRLHRAGAVRGSECERASLDSALLTHAFVHTGNIDDAARYASAPAKALLEERVEAGSATPEECATVALVQSLLDSRRRTTRLAVAALPTGAALRNYATKLADAQDWDDASWFASAVRYANDGRGAQQWYDRSLATWRAAQSAHTLLSLGVLRPDARLLIMADLRSPLVWGLANDVGRVVVVDVLARYPGGGAGPWIHAPERFATQVVPDGRVRAVAIEHMLDALDAQSFDAALVLPWNSSMSAFEIGALLAAVATHVVDGGPLLTCLPTRLAGPPQPGLLESPSTITRWLAARGMQLQGEANYAISDVGLLATTDSVARDLRVPNLLIANGTRLTGQLFVTCTRTSTRHHGHPRAVMGSEQ